MTSLLDSLNWDLVVRRDYVAQNVPNDPRTYIPIPPQTFLINTSYTVIVGCRSNSARAGWYTGCFASVLLPMSPSSTSQFLSIVDSGNSKRCKLDNLQLLQFRDVGILPYILEIRIPWYLTHIFLEIWKYSGDRYESTDLDLEAIKANLGI